MTPLSVAVLSLTAAATCWLWWYARSALPHQLDERIFESIKAFGTAIELRFPSHRGLMTRVVGLSQAAGRGLGLDHYQLRSLEEAARLRDIGLCAIPYRLVNTMHPTEWNVAEKATYLKHAEVGGAMLELIPELDHLSSIVRFHHHRFDGLDDPDGPSEGRIPVEARLLKVVADFVWFERYRQGEDAISIIQEGSGTNYCPACVQALTSVLTSSRAEQREPSLV